MINSRRKRAYHLVMGVSGISVRDEAIPPSFTFPFPSPPYDWSKGRRPPGAVSVFIAWTEWTLAMALSWWQHYKYRRGNIFCFFKLLLFSAPFLPFSSPSSSLCLPFPVPILFSSFPYTRHTDFYIVFLKRSALIIVIVIAPTISNTP